MKTKFKILLLLLILALISSAWADNLLADNTLAQKLKGRILLQVEDKGQAWYVFPLDLKRYYLGRPADAFNLMKNLGLGITNNDLNKIPSAEGGAADGANMTLAKNLAGQILIQVEDSGRAWYVNPTDLKRYYLGRPADAFNLMRQLGLGITNGNLAKIDPLVVKPENTNAYLTKNYTTPKTADTRTYRDAGNLYSFDYPAGWQIKKFPNSPNELQLTNAERDFIAEKKAVITIHKITVNEAAELGKFKIALNNNKITKLNERNFTVADKEAFETAYLYPLAFQKTGLIQLNEKNFLRVSLTAAKNNYSSYENVYDKLIRSLSLNGD